MLYIVSRCWLCQQSLRLPQQGICSFCLRNLPALPICCPRCGLPSAQADFPCGRCLRHPPLWQTITFVGNYSPPLSVLIKKLKFSTAPQLAPLLARLLLLKWLEAYWHGLMTKPDQLICVPLHHQRCWRRGFNQTALLAQPLAHWLGCRYDRATLQRVYATPPQQQLNAVARRRNMRGAFSGANSLSGKHIALLDDVVTTGSTVAEISKILLSQGVASIQIWCICRTL